MTKTITFFYLVLMPSYIFSQDLPEKDNLWIYFMAGQSNMAGRGQIETQDTIKNVRIWTINKDYNWKLAQEPLHFYEPSMAGLDCGMSFANELLTSLPSHVSIAIIPCAVGGSSVEQWLGDSTHRNVSLLRNFKDKADFVMDYGIVKGIIWHQGESNANSISLPTYTQRLRQLFTEFREILANKELPIIMGKIGAFSQPEEKARNWGTMNELLTQFAKEENNTFLIETNDLHHKGDFVHFDAAAQRTMGKRYAAQFVNLKN